MQYPQTDQGNGKKPESLPPLVMLSDASHCTEPIQTGQGFLHQEDVVDDQTHFLPGLYYSRCLLCHQLIRIWANGQHLTVYC